MEYRITFPDQPVERAFIQGSVEAEQDDYIDKVYEQLVQNPARTLRRHDEEYFTVWIKVENSWNILDQGETEYLVSSAKRYLASRKNN